MPPGDRYDLRNQGSLFEETGAVATFRQPLRRGEGEAALVQVAGVTTNSFHTLGIRVALGRDFVDNDGTPQARPPQGVAHVGRGLRLSVLGIVIGLGAAVALTRVMNTMLVGVRATDPITFAAIVVLFVAIASPRLLAAGSAGSLTGSQRSAALGLTARADCRLPLLFTLPLHTWDLRPLSSARVPSPPRSRE
jgi:hypothetical protein